MADARVACEPVRLMLLAQLVETSRRVAETRQKSQKITLLAECIRACEPAEREVVVAFASGEPRQGKIGVGPALIQKALPAASGVDTATLTVLEVDAVFSALGQMEGAGSGARRQAALAELFQRATDAERTFLVRLLYGELRQGAQAGILVEAIARAADVPAAGVRRAVMLAGDPATVADAVLSDGEAALGRFRLEIFRALEPMLAQSAEDLESGYQRLPELAIEAKLDGARVQVHRDGRDVRIFTRQLHDVTARLPEVVEAVLALPAERLVLDGEAIALTDSGRPQPFQVTMRRFGKKTDSARLRQQLPLIPYFFDCLHIDGDDLIDRPTADRIAALHGIVPEAQRVAFCVPGSQEQAERFLGSVLAAGHEGVMLKSLTAPYEAGRRGAAWLKLKPTHTLDLVVLAVERGSGRRSGWLSNLHLGARDPDTGGFVMLGKTFKGMTDKMLVWQTAHLAALAIDDPKAHVVHVRPELVVEIAFDSVQTSSQYPGGVALRFARVKRYRVDKTAAEADTIHAVRALLPPS